MNGYPVILNGDHAEFEQEWAGKDPKTRPDWPLPSFDAADWAAAFCKIANDHGFKDAKGEPIDEGWMIGWFANSLMRGFDEHAARVAKATPQYTVSISRDFGEARVVVLGISPEHRNNVIVQERDGDEWVQRGTYNSLSDDYAYSNAGDEAERIAKRRKRESAQTSHMDS